MSNAVNTFQDVTAIATGKATIREFAPVSPTEWVATLAIDSNGVVTPSYRITLTHAGDACLLDVASGQQLSCGRIAGKGGNTGRVQLAPTPGAVPAPAVAPGQDLSKLSIAQLQDVMTQAAAELARRASAAGDRNQSVGIRECISRHPQSLSCHNVHYRR